MKASQVGIYARKACLGSLADMICVDVGEVHKMAMTDM